jgi:predicted metal-dependent hydrolase
LWGSCHSRGVIRLNWRLIQKPLDLVDYVVAHELSHLIEMNHSAAFWRTVERVYPDYKAARKRLRTLG